jgi:hypothetical protein
MTNANNSTNIRKILKILARLVYWGQESCLMKKGGEKSRDSIPLAQYIFTQLNINLNMYCAMCIYIMHCRCTKFKKLNIAGTRRTSCQLGAILFYNGKQRTRPALSLNMEQIKEEGTSSSSCLIARCCGRARGGAAVHPPHRQGHARHMVHHVHVQTRRGGVEGGRKGWN